MGQNYYVYSHGLVVIIDTSTGLFPEFIPNIAHVNQLTCRMYWSKLFSLDLHFGGG